MNKKTLLSAIAGVFSVVMAANAQIVDTYAFTMNLNIPRIYNNNDSLGYRKYQPQKLTGELLFVYSESYRKVDVKIKGLYNRTHKVGGKPVTYECYEYPYDDNQVLVVGIGSNKTLKFT